MQIVFKFLAELVNFSWNFSFQMHWIIEALTHSIQWPWLCQLQHWKSLHSLGHSQVPVQKMEIKLITYASNVTKINVKEIQRNTTGLTLPRCIDRQNTIWILQWIRVFGTAFQQNYLFDFCFLVAYFHLLNMRNHLYYHIYLEICEEFDKFYQKKSLYQKECPD